MLEGSRRMSGGSQLAAPSEYSSLLYRRPTTDIPPPRSSTMPTSTTAPSESPAARIYSSNGSHHHHHNTSTTNVSQQPNTRSYGSAAAAATTTSGRRLDTAAGEELDGYAHERDGAGSPKDYWKNKVLPNGEPTPTNATSYDHLSSTSTRPLFTSGMISSARGNATTGSNHFNTNNNTPTNTPLDNYNRSTAHKALFDSRHSTSLLRPYEEMHKEQGWRTLPGAPPSQQVFRSRADNLRDQSDFSIATSTGRGGHHHVVASPHHHHQRVGASSSTQHDQYAGYVHTPTNTHNGGGGKSPFRSRGGEGAEGGRPYGSKLDHTTTTNSTNYSAPPADTRHSQHHPANTSTTSTSRHVDFSIIERERDSDGDINNHPVSPHVHAPTARSKVIAQQQQQQQDNAAQLLKRIETLAAEIKTQRHKRHEAENTVDRYERLLGPAEKFASTQVHLREELVKLRAHASKWAEEEQQLKDKVSELEGMLKRASYPNNNNNNAAATRSTPQSPTDQTSDGNGSYNRLNASQLRLENLQNRLGAAFGVRTKLLEELKEVNALSETYEAVDASSNAKSNNSRLSSGSDDDGVENNEDGGDNTLASTHHSWRLRGRQAEVELRLRTQDNLIKSLASALDVEKECLSGLGAAASFEKKRSEEEAAATAASSSPTANNPATSTEPTTNVNNDSSSPPTSPNSGYTKKFTRGSKSKGATTPTGLPSDPSVVKPGPEVEISRLMEILQTKNDQIAQMRELLTAVAKSGKLGVGEPVGDLHRADLLKQGSPVSKRAVSTNSSNGGNLQSPQLKSNNNNLSSNKLKSGGSAAAGGTATPKEDAEQPTKSSEPEPLNLPAALTVTDASLITSAFKRGEQFVNQMVPPNSPTAHPVALPIDVLSHLAERDEARLADIKHALKEGKSIKSTEDEDGLNDMDDPSSNLFSSPFYTILRSSEYDFNQAVASEIEFKKQAEGGPLSRREEELASLYEKQVMELKRQLRARDTENSVINRRCTEVMLQVVVKNERIVELEKKLLQR